MGVAGIFLAWLGTNFAIVGAGYGGLGAKVLGKRKDGAISSFNLVLLLPFFLLTWTVWHLGRWLSRAEPCHLIVPEIWLGRRVLARELPENITLLVDLTAEFAEPKAVRADKTYLCIPTLDGGVPSVVALRKLTETIATWQGNTYIHCAAGYGRSATVAVAVLRARGWESDRAEAYVRRVRPGASLNALQKRAIAQLYPATQNPLQP